METRVVHLEPGQTFRVCSSDMEYRLIYVNKCRAYVEPLKKRVAQIKSGDDVLTEFEAPGGRVNISPDTMVSPIGFEAVGQQRQQNRGVVREPSDELKKAVNPRTKRGQIVALLLEDPTGETPIKTIMDKFSMNRTLSLAHCYEMWHYHGIGYEVAGEVVRVTMPRGCTDPFTQEKV